jgi:putative zinc finger/helix-turn-helix YgiT family protein
MESDNIAHQHDGHTDVDRECPQCGEASITTYWHHDTFTYGSGDSAATLQVELPVRRCGSCELEFLDHEGERLRHDAVCRHLGVLSPSDISDIRKRFGMTRAAFAAVTGLGEATLNRWENGAIVQNLANDRYLRLLALPGVMASLKELTSPRHARLRPYVPSARKFQVLTVSHKYRRSQENFELRMVS